jgi:hypothetical protein
MMPDATDLPAAATSEIAPTALFMMFIVPEIALADTLPALSVLSTPSANRVSGFGAGVFLGAYFESRNSMKSNTWLSLSSGIKSSFRMSLSRRISFTCELSSAAPASALSASVDVHVRRSGMPARVDPKSTYEVWMLEFHDLDG